MNVGRALLVNSGRYYGARQALESAILKENRTEVKKLLRQFESASIAQYGGIIDMMLYSDAVTLITKKGQKI